MNNSLKKHILENWQKVGHFKTLGDYKREISIQKKLMELMQVGDFYYFIFAPSMNKIEFVSPEMTSILGYQPSEFTIEKILSIIHPDDLPYFIDFENTVIDFKMKLPPDKVMKYKTRYNYRIKKNNGEYIHILQQSTTIQTDEEGAILRNFAINTDISHLRRKSDTKMTLSFIGLEGEPSFIDVDHQRKFIEASCILTPREMEIVKLIANNQSSQEIANKLKISTETVSTHRKNINNKTGTKNALELVLYAFDKGWV